MIDDEQAQAERERMMDFKASTLAANLDKASKVLEMFDQIESEQKSAFIKPEEMEGLTVTDKQTMLSDFHELGLGFLAP